ncbi:MAG: hypothetical protein E7190_13430 [Erysipelotrichaceae bacterium]|nr:hypothetical protein [Erysipelotrichaceae bacterium]
MTLHDLFFVVRHFMLVMEKKYGCALLAGGRGRRMGGINKAELKKDRQTFAETIEAELNRTGMRCYLSTAAYDQKIPENWAMVSDSITGEDGTFLGPAAGICSCLMKADQDGLEGLFFVPCDAPFFRVSVIEALSMYIKEDTDAVCFRTPDGRIQTVFGWYSVHCIPLMKESLKRGRNKIMAMLEEMNTKIISSEEADLDEKLFANINRPEDYLSVNSERIHILIEGKKRAGKSTLIDRVLKETKRKICGYRTAVLKTDEEGYRYVYMYPASERAEITDENLTGITRRKVISVNAHVFETLGVRLLSEIPEDGLIVMDEIGYMEAGCENFRTKVKELFDGDIPVLAAIKDPFREDPYLDMIRNHPKARLFRLNEDNREEIYQEVLAFMKRRWEDS